MPGFVKAKRPTGGKEEATEIIADLLSSPSGGGGFTQTR
jgi:hypothetical protein